MYHKIQSLYKRDPDNNYKTFLPGEYSEPEFEYLKDNEWEFTEKVDGTNIRIMWDGEKVSIGGRTDNAQIPTRLLESLVEIFPRDNLKNTFGDTGDVTLYGEGYGCKIQKVGYKYLPNSNDFILFDVRIGDLWLTRKDVYEIALSVGCDSIPFLGTGTLDQAEGLVRLGVPSSLGNLTAEGLVMRPVVELFKRNGKRIITKLKTKDFQEKT